MPAAAGTASLNQKYIPPVGDELSGDSGATQTRSDNTKLTLESGSTLKRVAVYKHAPSDF